MTTQDNLDPCNKILCAKRCTDECGWSLSKSLCESGLVTEDFELNEGNCDPNTSGQSDSSGDNTGTIIAVVLGVVAALIVCFFAVIFIRRRNQDQVRQKDGGAFVNPLYSNESAASYETPVEVPISETVEYHANDTYESSNYEEMGIQMHHSEETQNSFTMQQLDEEPASIDI